MAIKNTAALLASLVLLHTPVFSEGKDDRSAKEGDRVDVIFETDYGNDADDAIALDVIAKYCDAGRMRLLGVSTHKAGDLICPAVDASLTWYGYGRVPLAKSPSPVKTADGNHYADSVAMKLNPDGTPAFAQAHRGKYEDAVTMYRRILSSRRDSSVVIISVGFGTNLALLLESGPDKFSPLTGRELVARKVKLLSVMAGDYRRDSFPEYNINSDIPAMRKVFDLWPGKILENPFEIGEKVKIPSSVINEKLAWGRPHPLLSAFNGLNPRPHDQCAFDVMSVIAIVQPQMFSLSPRGTVTVDAKGYNHFTPSPSGKHRYLLTSEEQDKALQEYIIELISTKPKHFRK